MVLASVMVLISDLRRQWTEDRKAADKEKRRKQGEWKAAMDMKVQHRKARNMQLKAERSQEQVELQERQEAAKVGALDVKSQPLPAQQCMRICKSLCFWPHLFHLDSPLVGFTSRSV